MNEEKIYQPFVYCKGKKYSNRSFFCLELTRYYGSKLLVLAFLGDTVTITRMSEHGILDITGRIVNIDTITTQPDGTKIEKYFIELELSDSISSRNVRVFFDDILDISMSTTDIIPNEGMVIHLPSLCNENCSCNKENK